RSPVAGIADANSEAPEIDSAELPRTPKCAMLAYNWRDAVLVGQTSSPVVIIGAGVFGLSTAIHLAERGYTNVKILDKQAYHDSQYSYDKGCDAASAGL
ncbi:hypothetical protein FALBO_17129, partial [Fusarium albosuccineum]